MKKKYLFAEFIILFAFFILPPLFVFPKNQTLTFSTFPLSASLRAVIAALLYLQFKSEKSENSFFYISKTLEWSALTLGFLMLIFTFFEFFSIFFLKENLNATNVPSLPSTFIEWIFVILTFLFGAFYEEVLYRLYLPQILKIFLFPTFNEKTKNKENLLIEIPPILIFALAHRYLGWIGVFNAASSAFILRICFLKTKNICAGTFSHFLYNFLLFLFAVLI